MASEYAKIPLTKGYFAIVDLADYDDLVNYKWFAQENDHTVYATRRLPRTNDGTPRREERMHRRLIPGTKYVDHINGDGLDNRRCNLRPATASQNRSNLKSIQKNNSSGYIGVHERIGKLKSRWTAYVNVPGDKRNHLGTFDSAVEAATVRDAAAIKYYGEFATLNFPHIKGEIK